MTSDEWEETGSAGPSDTDRTPPPRVDGRPPVRVDGRAPMAPGAAHRLAPAPAHRVAAGGRPDTGRPAPGGSATTTATVTRTDRSDATVGADPAVAPDTPAPLRPDVEPAPLASVPRAGGVRGGAWRPAAPEVVDTRGRRAVPTPPQPPFTPVDDDGDHEWEVTLPSAVGRTVTIKVGPTGLQLGGQAIDFDEIVGARFKVEVEAALLRRATSARMSVVLTRADGSAVKVTARNAASVAKADAIVSTLGFLWDLLGDTAGARQRDEIIERIVRGAEVQVGGLRLTTIGIAWKRNPIVRWSTVGDPVVERLHVRIPTEDEPIVVSIAADDAYMLPTLVPALRRRFRFT